MVCDKYIKIDILNLFYTSFIVISRFNKKSHKVQISSKFYYFILSTQISKVLCSNTIILNIIYQHIKNQTSHKHHYMIGMPLTIIVYLH
jgi:hypothetical protein